jgi:hypothetical protein
MRERTLRREPVFDDEPHPTYAPPNDDHGYQPKPHSRTARILAAPGRLLISLVLMAVVTAFVANALYFQKSGRPALFFDLSSVWRGPISLNPLNLFVRPTLEGTPASESAPQPPRRPEKVEAVPVPAAAPMATPVIAAPKQMASASLVASADPKQVFAPPQPIPDQTVKDPVGALVSQAMPKPDKSVLAAQRALNKMGYGPVSPDGLKSPALHEAVLRFQKDKHLPTTGEMDAITKPQLAKLSGLVLE